MKNVPYVLYRSDGKKIENLKKECKMRISILFSFTHYILPT